MSAPFILASASPRRHELLARGGYDLEVVSASVTERTGVHLSLQELTTANATRKALVVARRRPEATVLAADTLVALDGEIIGKPRNLRHARAILRRLSGRTHEVCTAVFITGARGRFASFAEISHVKFRWLSASDIAAYVRKIDPLDKAGAYAAQEQRRDIITFVEGSFTNIIGLPMERTVEALRRFGIQPKSRSRLPLPLQARRHAPVLDAKRDRGTRR